MDCFVFPITSVHLFQGVTPISGASSQSNNTQKYAIDFGNNCFEARIKCVDKSVENTSMKNHLCHRYSVVAHINFERERQKNKKTQHKQNKESYVSLLCENFSLCHYTVSTFIFNKQSLANHTLIASLFCRVYFLFAETLFESRPEINYLISSDFPFVFFFFLSSNALC